MVEPPGPTAFDELADLCALLAETDGPASELLGTIAARLTSIITDSCVISLVEREGGDGRQVLRVAAVTDRDPEVDAVLAGLGGVRVPADRGFTRYVLESARSLRLPETSPEVVLVGRPELREYAERFGLRSLILAPLRRRGRALGHVALLRRGEGDPYDTDDERFAQAAADLLGLALGGEGAGELAERASQPTGPAAELAEREREVLALLALGHTNREIAEHLVLSVRTVEWHRARIQWKLGVSGRAALASMAREHGLIE